ncbi:MAG: hypothetical protein ACMUIL_07775 [bacterium]
MIDPIPIETFHCAPFAQGHSTTPAVASHADGRIIGNAGFLIACAL